MLRHIIEKELFEIFKSIRFIFIFTASAVLILLSIFIGIRNYESTVEEYNASVSVMRETLENQLSWESLGVWGQYKIYKKPHILSVLVNGLENELGRSTVISFYNTPRLEESRSNTDPVFAIFGALDLAFVVKIVLSLLAILFTYDAICGERERGILKLVLSNSIPRDTLILGKWIGSFLGLVIPLSIPLVLGVLIYANWPGLSLSAEDLLAVFVLIVLFLLYMGVFITLGVFISARVSTSSISFLILLVAWILFVLIIPKMSVILAGQVVPVPSPAEIQASKQALGREWYREYFSYIEDWLNEHPQRRSLPPDQQVPPDVVEKLNKELKEKYELKIQQVEENYLPLKRRQLEFAMAVSRISPASSLSFASMSIAHTGIDRQRAFLQAATQHQREFADYVGKKIMETRRDVILGRAKASNTKKLNISDMPNFVFIDESLSRSLSRVYIDFILLALLIILFFAGGYFSFLKYDVR